MQAPGKQHTYLDDVSGWQMGTSVPWSRELSTGERWPQQREDPTPDPKATSKKTSDLP